MSLTINYTVCHSRTGFFWKIWISFTQTGFLLFYLSTSYSFVLYLYQVFMFPLSYSKLLISNWFLLVSLVFLHATCILAPSSLFFKFWSYSLYLFFTTLHWKHMLSKQKINIDKSVFLLTDGNTPDVKFLYKNGKIL